MEAIHNPNGTTTVMGKCVITGKVHAVTVPTKGFESWRNGEFIQRAMPNVKADDREFLISGISPAGWAKTFPEE